MCRYNSTSHGYLYLQHQWHDLLGLPSSDVLWVCTWKLVPASFDPRHGVLLHTVRVCCVLCVSIFGVCVCTYVSVFVCIYVYVHCEGCTQISSEETIMQPKAIFCQLKSWSQTQTLLQESWGALYMGDSQLLWNMLCWTFALNFSLSSYPSLLKAWAMGAYDEGPRPADLEHCFLRSVIAWAHWSFRA